MPKNNGNSLLRAAGSLKTIQRAGWVKKAGIKDAESVADHSFRMAVIGMYLGEVMELGLCKNRQNVLDSRSGGKQNWRPNARREKI